MSAFKIVLILIALFELAICQLPQSQQYEQNLTSKLLSSSLYSRDIRADDTVSVSVSVQLKQIISLDEKNQILSITCFIEQFWNDPRLTWIPANWNNTEVLMLSLKKIWSPDTIVMNSADGDGYLKINADYSYMPVQYDGEVYFASSLIALKTRCPLNMGSYPFDTQSCTIRFASWAYGDNKIFFSVNDSIVDTSDYTEHPIWTLTSSSLYSQQKSDRSPFEDTSNTEIVLKLNLTRKPLYYMMNSVFPCLLLNLVTLFTFFMVPSSASGIVMSGFLTFSLYSARMQADMPTQSDYMPDITSYFMMSISLNLIAFLWFIYMNRCLIKSDMPLWLEKFGELVKKIFCLCFPPDKKDSAKVANADVPIVVVSDGPKPNSIENLESEKTNVLPKTTETLEKVSKIEDKKSKCDFCKRCSECESDFKKDKDKGKRKKDVESKLESLNYLAFVIMITAMLIGNLSVWINLKK